MPYLSDPIGDLITRMRNAQGARRATCRAPWSSIKEQLCLLLQREGWLENVEVLGQDPKRDLEVTFVPGKTLTLARISKPGRRMYTGAATLRPVLHGFGIAILTTSLGLLTDKEARRKKVGGEILCTVS
ncbi:MAG: small subunit ribosomal protein S8 [Candidatus Peregrinibacteria bacterium Greene0416_19]|nr:MAG: small subunit ribosomal protein S8 [Candidatus Peregrinibacteria bacterium Greene0416_19]